jgi:hypothetical protein
MSDDESLPPAAPAPAPAPEGALCAVHVGVAADSICSRCGNYMCAACSQSRSFDECLACRERSGAGSFPFDRNNYQLFALLDFAWDVFRRNWVPLTLAAAAMLVVSQGAALALRVAPLLTGGAEGRPGAWFIAASALGFGVQIVTQIGGQLVLYGWALRAIEGEPLELDDGVRALRRLPEALAQLVVIWLPFVALCALFAVPLVMLGMAHKVGSATLLIAGGALVLLIVPVLVYVGIGVAFASLVLVQDESIGAVDAIRESWGIVAGHRWRVFGAMFVIGMIMGAGLLLCCVGVFPTMAYGTLGMTCLYKALRSPRD